MRGHQAGSAKDRHAPLRTHGGTGTASRLLRNGQFPGASSGPASTSTVATRRAINHHGWFSRWACPTSWARTACRIFRWLRWQIAGTAGQEPTPRGIAPSPGPGARPDRTPSAGSSSRGSPGRPVTSAQSRSSVAAPGAVVIGRKNFDRPFIISSPNRLAEELLSWCDCGFCGSPRWR